MERPGCLYENGLALPKDLGQALQNYREAADAGIEIARGPVPSAISMKKGMAFREMRNRRCGGTEKD